MTPCASCGGVLVDALGDCVRCRIVPPQTVGMFSNFGVDLGAGDYTVYTQTSRRCGKSRVADVLDIVSGVPVVRNPARAKYLRERAAQRPVAVAKGALA